MVHFIYILAVFALGYLARPIIEEEIKEAMRNLYGK
jgi:hypothetical protein